MHPKRSRTDIKNMHTLRSTISFIVRTIRLSISALAKRVSSDEEREPPRALSRISADSSRVTLWMDTGELSDSLSMAPRALEMLILSVLTKFTKKEIQSSGKSGTYSAYSREVQQPLMIKSSVWVSTAKFCRELLTRFFHSPHTLPSICPSLSVPISLWLFCCLLAAAVPVEARSQGSARRGRIASLQHRPP